jgi:hypothetical protein
MHDLGFPVEADAKKIVHDLELARSVATVWSRLEPYPVTVGNRHYALQ